MGKWFSLIYQIIDFVVKAMAAYALSPDGQREWQDIENAWEVAANEDDNEGASFQVRETGNPPYEVQAMRQADAQSAGQGDKPKRERYNRAGERIE